MPCQPGAQRARSPCEAGHASPAGHGRRRRGSDAGSPAAEGTTERLRQLLHRSGLESDGEGGGSGADAGDSDDGDDEAEDLDAMASGLQSRVGRPRLPCPTQQIEQWVTSGILVPHGCALMVCLGPSSWFAAQVVADRIGAASLLLCAHKAHMLTCVSS